MTLEQLEEIVIRLILLEKFKQQTLRNRLERYFLYPNSSLKEAEEYFLVPMNCPDLAYELYFRISRRVANFPRAQTHLSGGKLLIPILYRNCVVFLPQ